MKDSYKVFNIHVIELQKEKMKEITGNLQTGIRIRFPKLKE